MAVRFSIIWFSILFVAVFTFSAAAQVDTSSQNGRPQPKEDLPSNIKETLAKQRIAREKKDYDELVEAGTDFSGKIVIVRYGGIYRGLKVYRIIPPHIHMLNLSL